MEIAAMETRVKKEVCFLRTYAVVTTLFCGGEENLKLCPNSVGKFHVMPDKNFINDRIVCVSY
jgi:hypothetical protein